MAIEALPDGSFHLDQDTVISRKGRWSGEKNMIAFNEGNSIGKYTWEFKARVLTMEKLTDHDMNRKHVLVGKWKVEDSFRRRST